MEYLVDYYYQVNLKCVAFLRYMTFSYFNYNYIRTIPYAHLRVLRYARTTVICYNCYKLQDGSPTDKIHKFPSETESRMIYALS